MYQVKRECKSEFVPIRGLNYHVQTWGTPKPGKPPLVLLHGWMDVAASYQFVVDALTEDHWCIAPHWRGFGLTEVPETDHFVFADYLGDLEFLLDHYVQDTPLNLVGHSMGGNVAMLYAGVRPERIRRLINLEGFGMPRTVPAQAPERFARWMDELKALHRGAASLRSYNGQAGVAQRLMKTNPRLSADKAMWLAGHWAKPGADDAEDQWHILGHAAHKLASAQLYRADEAQEVFKRITAPTLCVEAGDDSLKQWWKGTYTLEEFHQRMQAVAKLEVVTVDNAGHMLHHDQPEAVAELIEAFIAR